MNLSEHFTLAEAVTSSTAQRMGIDNTPSPEAIERMKAQAAGMEFVRAVLQHPIHVDSWYRCEALERVLCDVDYRSWCKRHGRDVTNDTWRDYFRVKAHPKGLATDFICPSFGSPGEIAAKLATTVSLKFDQLIMEGTWVHISFAPSMRRIVRTAVFSKGEVAYLNGVKRVT